MFLCMAVFTGYAQKHVSRLDSVQRLNEVVVLLSLIHISEPTRPY